MTAPRCWRLTPLCIALSLALAPCAGAWAATVRHQPAALAAPPQAREADALFERAVLDGQLDETCRRLEAQAAQAPGRPRADALLMLARVQWRAGRWAEADRTVDRALAAMPLAAALLFKGELLDAMGQPRQALRWLQQARTASTDPRLHQQLDLRLAVLQATLGDADALAQHAAKAGQASRWRAALVLGLLGQPARALALSDTGQGGAAGGDTAFEMALRQADWALQAGDVAQARRHAWRAVQRAAGAGERRYALAVWVEAWRAGQDLAGAVQMLAQQPATPELLQARVDLLLELGRADEALALVQRAADPALRQNLLAVLQATGRTADVEREYRRLIAEQAGELRWVEALAELLLARGDEPGAVQTYQQFVSRNRQQPAAVIAAVRSMITRGLTDAADAALQAVPPSPELAQASRSLRLERYLDQGQEAAALQILDDWRASLPPRSPDLAQVAEGYERLGRRAQALAVLQAWQAAGGPLDDEQQAHVAELLAATGQEREALAQWRALWARARLPARKDFLERKIISSAKQLDGIAPLADELQARLQRGEANADELSLLLNLRIAAADAAGAQAALQTYAQQARLGEQARLEQLARVHARMRNSPALVQTLRRLARLDPAAAPDYLRQALQTLLQQPAARAAQGAELPAEVKDIVAELQARSGLGSAENSRYLAGIYAASGLQTQALALYRRALALAPADGDSLLQLVDALKRGGQGAEAASLLQQAAQQAATPEAFATAISGLIDLFGSDADGREGEDSSLGLKSSRLSWALRQVLTRIAEAGDDVRYNSLVADIALSQQNAALQRRAYEAALPVAQDQRAAVLRQLIALSSEQKAAAPGELPRAADLPRKLAFGRRLIALRQDFAAGVYADLARSLLAQGDLPGAERAFSMVDDNGGLTNVAALRAGAYAEAGRIDEALANYRLALLRDPDDVDTLLAASLLRERKGQTALAWRGYWQGLLGLLRRQPLLRDGLSESAALDVSQYLPTLVEGVLLNWPADPPTATQALADWRALFEQTAGQLDTARPLADQVRLQAWVQVNRRLAEQLGPEAGLQALEDRLAQPLAGDPAFAADRRAHAHQTGRVFDEAAPAVATAAPDWPLQALSLQAADQGQTRLNLLLSMMRHDEAALQALAQQALAAELRAREGRRAQATQAPRTLGMWLGMVRSAVGRVPAAQLDAWLVRPLEATPIRDEVLFDLYRGDLASFNALEQALGRRLLSASSLMDLLVTRFGDPLPEAAIRRQAAAEPGAAGGAGAGLARFSPDEQLALLQRLVQVMEQGEGTSALLDLLLSELLRQPLDPARSARLGELAARMTGVTTAADDFGQPPAAAGNVRRLLVLDLPPARQAALLAMAQRFAEQAPVAAPLPAFLRAWYAGDDEQAYRAWLDLQDGLRELPNGTALQMPVVTARFEAPRQREVDAFLAMAQPSAADAARFYRRHVLHEAGGTAPPPAEQARRLRALHRAVPDNAAYLGALLSLDLQLGDWAAVAQDLTPYVRSQPGDREAATLLGLVLRLLGEPQQAQEIAQAAAVDLDDADWLLGLWDLGRAARAGAASGALRSLFPTVFQAYLDSPIVPPAVVKALPDQLQPEGGQEPQMLSADEPWPDLLAMADDAAALQGRLRQLWRETLGGGDEQRGARQRWLASLPKLYAIPGEPAEARRLRALFLQQPVVSQELDAWLRALAPAVRQSQGSMYGLLAHALVRQGRAPQQRQALLDGLAQDRLSGHELQLLAALVDAQRQGLGPRELDLLEARLRRQPSLAAAARLQFARVFARSGREDLAERLLRVAVLQLLYPAEQEGGTGMAPAPTLAQAVNVLSLWKDGQAADQVQRALAELVAESRSRDGTGGRHPEPFPQLPPLPPKASR